MFLFQGQSTERALQADTEEQIIRFGAAIESLLLISLLSLLVSPLQTEIKRVHPILLRLKGQLWEVCRG